jgi:hypothetical protein
MLIGYWADPRPRKNRRDHALTRRRSEAAIIPSPFDPLNRQFYASVDRDFDAGTVDIAPGIRVDCASENAEQSVAIDIHPRRRTEITTEREF